MNQEASLPDEGGPSASRLEHDALRDFPNFEIASGTQAQPVPQWFGQDHAAGFVHF